MATLQHEQAASSRPAVMPGWVVNVALRLCIVLFTINAVLNPHDDRYQGKNLGARNLVILFGFSLLFPVLHSVWRKWRDYPVWYDSLYLSMFWLDMFGNYYGLFDHYQDFDLLPHFHGPGAVAVVLAGAFGVAAWPAFIVTMGLHALLELQEYLGDVLFGTHNVRGWWDTAHDLAAGLAGGAVYLWLWCHWHSRHKRPPEGDPEAPGNSGCEGSSLR
jgi:hypothetical protein